MLKSVAKSRSLQNRRTILGEVNDPKYLNAGFPFVPFATASIALVAIFGWGPNFSLCLLSAIVLIVGSCLCWRPGEPAVILFIFGYQWLQASVAIFVANLNGLPIDATAQISSANMGAATALSLLGLLTMVACFRLTAGSVRKLVVQRAECQAAHVSVNTLAIAYGISLVGGAIIAYLATISEGLRQPILTLLTFKDAVFLIVAYVGFKRRGPFLALFATVFMIEFISSLGGFFSSFQTVFIYTFIAMFAAGVRLRLSNSIGAGFLIVIAVFIGIVWTAVKTEYRAYLNGGTGQQIVSVGFVDAVGTLGKMVSTVDGDQLIDGADRLVRRLTYVELFGASIKNVPAVVEHTNGALWGSAVIHTFTPRYFFPDKAAIDSSQQTNRYTGVRVAGRDEGAQISIGYMGESYIDFGFWGMFIPLALYGGVMGLLYQRVLSLPKFSGLLSMGLCVPLIMGGFYLNAETIKMVGDLILTALAIFAAHAMATGRIRALLLGERNAMKSRSPTQRSVPSAQALDR